MYFLFFTISRIDEMYEGEMDSDKEEDLLQTWLGELDTLKRVSSFSFFLDSNLNKSVKYFYLWTLNSHNCGLEEMVDIERYEDMIA